MKKLKEKDGVTLFAFFFSATLHGACLLPGHILVNESFRGSAVVKALQGWSSYLVHGVLIAENGYLKVGAKIHILQPLI